MCRAHSHDLEIFFPYREPVEQQGVLRGLLRSLQHFGGWCMTIEVRFPDGSRRDVPSELRILHADSASEEPAFWHVPLNCDSYWRFAFDGVHWNARPRTGSLAMFRSPGIEWWRGIVTMSHEAALGEEQCLLVAVNA
jgi:hypothetical protein